MNETPKDNKEEIKEEHPHFPKPPRELGHDAKAKSNEKHWHRKSMERGRHEHSGQK
ncbi:hypothetical protein ACFL5G_03750 [Candidatus Margulisiibacteriota bacterium]